MKKINFCLPGGIGTIVGGFKIIFQYSNYLVENGYDVAIYYDSTIATKDRGALINYIVFNIKRLKLLFYPTWFKLNKRVKQYYINGISDSNIRDADVSFATAYETSDKVNKLFNSKGKKMYLIQDYEKWRDITDQDLINSYKMGFVNIAVSKWLKDIIDQTSNAYLVPNGYDNKVFRVIKPIEERDNNTISMLYHTDERKASKFGLKAIMKLKDKYPELKLILFGNPDKPDNLPDWITYKKKASEKEVVKILNDSSIYVCSSLVEGFGLPGMEAMACGCALVTTDCLGIKEYATSDNSLICSPGNEEELSLSIERLLKNNEYRVKVAKRGNIDIQSRRIEESYKKLEIIIQENIGGK